MIKPVELKWKQEKKLCSANFLLQETKNTVKKEKNEYN